mmetsp:Transcript_15110/g.38991  ORF Transcript_15110/g.38991 Transcript_15110/m.38991 type:complete len:204 (-) Transcript_15110:935-1546(-)
MGQVCQPHTHRNGQAVPRQAPRPATPHTKAGHARSHTRSLSPARRCQSSRVASEMAPRPWMLAAAKSTSNATVRNAEPHSWHTPRCARWRAAAALSSRWLVGVALQTSRASKPSSSKMGFHRVSQSIRMISMAFSRRKAAAASEPFFSRFTRMRSSAFDAHGRPKASQTRRAQAAGDATHCSNGMNSKRGSFACFALSSSMSS